MIKCPTQMDVKSRHETMRQRKFHTTKISLMFTPEKYFGRNCFAQKKTAVSKIESF